jgi:hypothetical protein
MDEIKVVNHNKETLYGRFDGEDFEFAPEVPTCLPLDAAKHIFGLGNEDKSQVLNALGWLVPGEHGMTYKEALAKYDQISFLQGRTVYDDEPSTGDDALPMRGARNKTGGRPHVTGPGGESAAGGEPAAANP